MICRDHASLSSHMSCSGDWGICRSIVQIADRLRTKSVHLRQLSRRQRKYPQGISVYGKWFVARKMHDQGLLLLLLRL